ncbi:MAG: hypothetical protein HOV80_15680 [Polyangiaceae bacterium]|nr:hypothetical protein [Polyangiaceae bacterium]
MKRNTVFLAWALFGSAAIAVAACSASPGVEDDDDGDGGRGSSDDDDGSTSAGFTDSTGTSMGSGCSDPSCIGANPQGNCDSGLSLDSADAMDGAKAIGICQASTPGGWGVIEANWVRSDGQPLQGGDGGIFGDGGTLEGGKGILSHFGNSITPREGSSLLALSSGAARNPADPGFYDPGGNWKDSIPHGTPSPYPKTSPSCSTQAGEAYDSAGLRLKLQVPSDAKSFSFNLNFYTYEYPDYICSVYNDFFVAMMDPPDSTLPDGNISFDSQGNTISVNAGFLQVCNEQTASNGVYFPCPMGPGELAGTGFDSQPNGSAATGWLETKAPVTPGSQVTLLFTIWDSGDGVLDSTTLIDNFKFTVDETATGTAPIPQ